MHFFESFRKPQKTKQQGLTRMNHPWPTESTTLKHASGRFQRLSRITSDSQANSLPHKELAGFRQATYSQYCH